MATPNAVKGFFQSHKIPVLLPTDEEYPSTAIYYSISDPKAPLAAVRVRNTDDIAIAIEYAHQHGIEVIVRTGGGDLFGRSPAAGALVIDMRSINQVEVDAKGRTARVGGGCNVGQVAAALAPHGLVTSCPPVPTVGYVGWATLGGYGPLVKRFGLGLDQIVGAKLVNYKGELTEASEELLKGLRGGGGNFGVVVELTVKVYPVKKILAGMIAFDSTDLGSQDLSYAQAHNELLQEGIPNALGLQPAVVNHDEGRLFIVMILWSSDDHDTGYQWVDKIAATGKELMRTVKPMTTYEWQTEMGKLVPYNTYGYATAVSVASMTEQIASVVAQNVGRLPSDPGTMFSLHEFRGPSAAPNPRSVFRAREPHFVLELIGVVRDPRREEESEAWITRFRSEVLECDGVSPFDYISLTRPAHTSLQRLYGDNLGELLRLKKKYDPEGTFNLAVPRLGEMIKEEKMTNGHERLRGFLVRQTPTPTRAPVP